MAEQMFEQKENEKQLAAMDMEMPFAVALMSDYPFTAQLLNQETMGTIALLEGFDILERLNPKQTFDIPHDGNGPQSTWSAYKDIIKKHLERVNNKKWLEQGREAVAKILRDRYYEKYPKWPPTGESWPKYTTHIDVTGAYEYKCKIKGNISKHFKIAWACSGNLTMWDEHPEKNVYKCHLMSPKNDKMTLRVLRVDIIKLNQFEKMIECPQQFNVAMAKAQKKRFEMMSGDEDKYMNDVDDLASIFAKKTAFG